MVGTRVQSFLGLVPLPILIKYQTPGFRQCQGPGRVLAPDLLILPAGKLIFHPRPPSPNFFRPAVCNSFATFEAPKPDRSPAAPECVFPVSMDHIGAYKEKQDTLSVLSDQLVTLLSHRDPLM